MVSLVSPTTFSQKLAARGMYRRWADLLIHEKWEDVEAAADEYEKELMK